MMERNTIEITQAEIENRRSFFAPGTPDRIIKSRLEYEARQIIVQRNAEKSASHFQSSFPNWLN